MLNTTSERYGQAIVETLAASKRGSSLQSSLAIAGPLKSIEERLRSIMKPNKQFHKRASSLHVVCILLIALTLVPFAWQPTHARAVSSLEAEDVESERAASIKKRLMPIPPGQILFQTKYYIVDKAKNTPDARVPMSVRVDEAYAKELAELVQQKKGVKCIANPSCMSNDGKTATLRVITEEHFMLDPQENGEGVLGQIEPQILESGLTLLVVGRIQEDGSTLRLLIETQMHEAFSWKDEVRVSRGETPFQVSNGVKVRITTENGQSVVISGMGAPDDPDRFIVAVITPTFMNVISNSRS